MTQDQHTRYWLFYRGIRWSCSHWRVNQQQRAHKRWHLTNPLPPGGHRCWICADPIDLAASGARRFSFDHVIAQDYIYRYELSTLLFFDSRNLRPAHQDCNSTRSNKLLSVPEAKRLGIHSAWMLRQLHHVHQVMRREQADAARPEIQPPVVRKWLERAGKLPLA